MRIVSLAPSVTEILFAIGRGADIVANTAYCDYPQEAKKIPKLGSWIYIDDEKIKKLKPDLVITATVVQHQAHKRYKDFKHLHLDPRSLADIYDNILLLGKVTKHLDPARDLVQNMKIKEKNLSSTLRLPAGPPAGRPGRQVLLSSRIYIEEWFDPPMVSGNWVPDIVALSGGNYFPGIKKGGISRKVTNEEIKRFNPEVIFVSYCGYKDKSDPKKILDRSDWQDIDAVKNQRVYVLNDDLLNRPGPRVLEAAEKIRGLFVT